MTISYTDEMKMPLNEDGGYNWGAIFNGIVELLDKGHELTFTFAETVSGGEVVALKADGEIYKANALDSDLTPAIGFAPYAVTAGNEGKVRYFGWIDVDTSFSAGATKRSWSAGEPVYPDSVAGRICKTHQSWANPVGYAKGATDASYTTRIVIQPSQNREALV